ncbi:Tigger transposable element-derived protein 6 [Araneus ventricosus]|uniref:Tigger transposable element-derived protein 6 n=1 Tax=Araneus ventricosus TaxID=182803 RepID=A0A4Y2NS98_ARAVE|nr:Tigger transposable element-derived protein 6 [Araneus ventricosus]
MVSDLSCNDVEGVFLNLEQRKMLRQYDNGKSARKLAELFYCGRTQINKIIKEKDLNLKEYEDYKFRGVKRMRHGKYVIINEAVSEWFKTVRAKTIPVSGAMIQYKAKELADALGIENFSSSNGWMDRFRIRNNITFRSLCGEAADVDPSLCEDWQKRLPLLLAGYDDEDIFEIDETALFFRALPNKSMIQKSKEARGEKIPKEGLTISFCVSAAREKEKPLVIWRCQKRRCFKGKDLNRLAVSWYANKKAWMASSIFEEWLVNLDKKLRNRARKVLLVLDNATCHAHGAELKNVKLLILPPNTTSKLQLLDHGVLKCYKMEYRQCALRHVIERMDGCESPSELSKKISVGDALDWIKTFWKN